MTDFFDDLERELRGAHRRDIDRRARSRVFDLRRLPGLPATGLRALVALAVVVALVAVVLAVVHEAGVERLAAPPQPSPTTASGEGGCDPSDWWQAPIVDEPIPRAIASRFAIFRDPPHRMGRSPGSSPQERKQYRGALTLRPRLDTGARLRVVITAADITFAQPDRDFCAPPPGPIVPGICILAIASKDEHGQHCFSIDQIEDAEAWFEVTRQTVVGLAPDGVDRVTFDTPAGTQSLHIGGNIFAGEIRSADKPPDTDTRFAP